ncbi:hypothetical protein DXT76_10810 [Halobacillus trueperi]|uniref:Uncharacterized protein n=1 Tax=Halobacillus trueperi TaxID=156205 RepID=A0A3D8VNP0_9BACI|nr:hypothetical protein [Halobacillus trueperi]RDY70867.1 hypothetical protein DXT76_10810 [Halobacillus trueperi]
MGKSIEETNIIGNLRSKKKKDKKSPYVGPSMQELREPTNLKPKVKRKSTEPKKMVNTQVPEVVLDAFLLYCARNNHFRNNAFPKMLKFVLNKYKNDVFQFEDNINGSSVFDCQKVSANFEVPVELMQDVRTWKAIKKVNYQDIYSQAIVQYLNQHT